MSTAQEVEQVVVSLRNSIKDIPNRFKANKEAISDLFRIRKDLKGVWSGGNKLD